MKTEKLIGIFLLLIVLLYGSIKNFNLMNHDFYEVTFFDIKLGDTTFIKTPENRTILIDGGLGNDLLPKLSSKLGFFENKIDLVILSHPQSDHIGGLIELIRNFKIGEIYMINEDYEGSEFDEFLKIIGEKNIKYKFANESTDLIFDNNLMIDILYPFINNEGEKYCKENINNCGIVFKATIGKNRKSILFTGDIEKPIEELLVKKVPNLKANILKSPHHGSKSALSENFLKIVKPEKAIIMASKDNKFGHPHKEVLNAYQKNGIETLVTANLGDIVLRFE